LTPKGEKKTSLTQEPSQKRKGKKGSGGKGIAGSQGAICRKLGRGVPPDKKLKEKKESPSRGNRQKEEPKGPVIKSCSGSNQLTNPNLTDGLANNGERGGRVGSVWMRRGASGRAGGGAGCAGGREGGGGGWGWWGGGEGTGVRSQPSSLYVSKELV